MLPSHDRSDCRHCHRARARRGGHRAGVGARPGSRWSQALCGRALKPREATLPAVSRRRRASRSTTGWRCTFPAPHSFTGEDVLELQAHGGPVVLQLLLARCLAGGRRNRPGTGQPRLAGLRVAQPGEFTERAFLNDKIDLAQAEAIADLIDASTEAAARSASRSLSGEFSGEIHGAARCADPPAHAGRGHARLPRGRDRLPAEGRCAGPARRACSRRWRG